MLEQDNILADYRPLQPVCVGDVSDHHPEHGEHCPYLSEYDFIWAPYLEKEPGVQDKPVSERRKPQLYLADQSFIFKAEGSSHADPQALREKLRQQPAGEPFRLPMISHCWGMEQVWMFDNSLLEQLSFAPQLGITATAATLIDPCGDERNGYTALCFHKALSASRAVERLTPLPLAQRLLINIGLSNNKQVLLIHTSLLERWCEQGADLTTEFEEKYLSLKKLARNEYYSGYSSRSFHSLADYQAGENGHLWCD